MARRCSSLHFTSLYLEMASTPRQAAWQPSVARWQCHMLGLCAAPHCMLHHTACRTRPSQQLRCFLNRQPRSKALARPPLPAASGATSQPTPFGACARTRLGHERRGHLVLCCPPHPPSRAANTCGPLPKRRTHALYQHPCQTLPTMFFFYPYPISYQRLPPWLRDLQAGPCAHWLKGCNSREPALLGWNAGPCAHWLRGGISREPSLLEWNAGPCAHWLKGCDCREPALLGWSAGPCAHWLKGWISREPASLELNAGPCARWLKGGIAREPALLG